MPQASSSFASLCDWLLEALGHAACATTLIPVPLLSLLIAASWGLVLPQQLPDTDGQAFQPTGCMRSLELAVQQPSDFLSIASPRCAAQLRCRHLPYLVPVISRPF